MKLHLDLDRFDLPLRLAAVAAWAVLTVLSLLPGPARPHTGASGNIEHALAYGLAGFVTRLAFRRTESRRQLLAFSLLAAWFEICQIWIPGRGAGAGNWLASTAGALVGIGVARWVVEGRPRLG